MEHYIISTLLHGTPAAVAQIQGSPSFPAIQGLVSFYSLDHLVLMQAAIEGLPHSSAPCSSRFFGFHLHEGNSCHNIQHSPSEPTPTNVTPFPHAGSHYNPNDCPHPAHAGDLPPLLSCHGIAWTAFLTDRFRVTDVIGRTLIIHEQPDDFTSQPSGNSGTMIACGLIQKRNSFF